MPASSVSFNEETLKSDACELVRRAAEDVLNMSGLKGVRFITPIIDCYRRHETSVKVATLETFLTGVSIR